VRGGGTVGGVNEWGGRARRAEGERGGEEGEAPGGEGAGACVGWGGVGGGGGGGGVLGGVGGGGGEGRVGRGLLEVGQKGGGGSCQATVWWTKPVLWGDGGSADGKELRDQYPERRDISGGRCRGRPGAAGPGRRARSDEGGRNRTVHPGTAATSRCALRHAARRSIDTSRADGPGRDPKMIVRTTSIGECYKSGFWLGPSRKPPRGGELRQTAPNAPNQVSEGPQSRRRRVRQSSSRGRPIGSERHPRTRRRQTATSRRTDTSRAILQWPFIEQYGTTSRTSRWWRASGLH